MKMSELKFTSVLSKEKIIDHLVQAVLIFMSVFLAFWLTEYRENQNTEKEIKLALENVSE